MANRVVSAVKNGKPFPLEAADELVRIGGSQFIHTDSTLSAAGVSWLLDEDDLVTDSATQVPTQQSAKAFVTSGTVSFTNKIFDANGTGNSISNIETADFATNVVDTDDTLAADSDTRLASQQAIKGYVDTQISTVAGAGIELIGSWDASTTAFPTGANQGNLYYCTVAGTVDGYLYNIGDQIIAIVDAASTTTFASNWIRLDNTESADIVRTGTTLTAAGVSWLIDDDTLATAGAGIVASSESIKAYVDSGTVTFTNKTFDANGTGNSLSNIETADFATNVVDTDDTLAADSDTRLASQQAVKAYVDGKNRIQIVSDGFFVDGVNTFSADTEVISIRVPFSGELVSLQATAQSTPTSTNALTLRPQIAGTKLVDANLDVTLNNGNAGMAGVEVAFASGYTVTAGQEIGLVVTAHTRADAWVDEIKIILAVKVDATE